MNPQFAPQQPFGAPPPNFPQSRASPALGPPSQTFETIPLGGQKQFVGVTPMGPSPMARPNPAQVPPSQLPPTQFGAPPTSKPGDMNGGHFQNGPPPTSTPTQLDGPPRSTPGPGFPSQTPPSNQPPLNNQPFARPPSSNQPPGPQAQPPAGNQPRGQPPGGHQPPMPGQPPRQPQMPGQPPISHQPPISGQPPLGLQQQMGGVAPNNQPPMPGQQHPTINQLPLGQQQQQNPKQPINNQPPLGHHQQLPGGQPPMGNYPQMPGPGQPPLGYQPQPPMPGQPPQGLHQQPPQGLHQQPPQGLHQQPPQGLHQQPPQGPHQQPPQGLHQQPPMPGLPPQGLHQQPPQGLHQQPPLGPHQQPPMPGQPPLGLHQQPPMPGGPQFNNAPPPPNLFNQPPGPNRMGPMPGQFNQPPMPAPQGPPLPGQLPNQMQGMNLGGARQYPGGPMKTMMNGENTPQQYVNGQQQQMRAPPGPGFPPMIDQPGNYQQQGYQSPQQTKRLDPDHMPSPVQVMQDDQQTRTGVFCTNQKGMVPPLVTTNFTVQDQGNCSPRFIRSSMYHVPVSNDIMKQTSVPFSLVISPMARTVDQEYPPPIVNFGDLGPVRCIRCKAYMCPFMQFIDSGRRFQCLFCKATTDVPNEYFQHLDHTGQRLDRYERPELVLGTYEFVATTDYCRNNTLPKPPAIIFIIDVSYNNIKSGLVHLMCSQMKDIIKHLPVDQGHETSNMKVGFITYNSSVHFYNIKGNLAAPQMLIVGDTQEMFMPLLDGFLCTPEESGPVIDSLMQQIPAMFGDTRETETILLPAILAGLEALKASDTTGKLLVFHSTLPTAEAPGKLKNRDERKLLGTDKERTVLTPQNQAYNQLGQDCVAAGCSVDLFIFNNAYIDLATIGQVSRLTGGEVHKFTYFQADIDGERLVKDIITGISRPVAFDSIMRVRTSTGVRPTDFYGHFFMSNTTDMELAAIDCDKAVAVEIKHDDKLSEEEGVYIQAALLYTSCSGQRRLRIINLSLKTCSQMAELYRGCDCDTIINFIAKQSAYKLLEHNPKIVKDTIVSRAAQMLATYRKNCASPSSAGQLILPECMKLLPLYVNCLLKSDALSGGSDMTIDDRSYVMMQVMTMDIPSSVNYFYPRLIPLVDLDVTQEPVEVPPPIRCTLEKMNEQGVYLLENGIHMFLWIGLGVNPEFIQKVFGVQSAIQVDIERTVLPDLDNKLSMAVRGIIEDVRVERHRCMRLTIVRQREKLEPVFKHFLAEDRGTDGSASYVDFLVHMHKEIRALLS